MRFMLCCLVLSLCSVTMIDCNQIQPSKKELRIILLRHAEKPDAGDNLSCRGFNRSLKLVNVLYSRYGIPDYIYVPAPAYGKQTKNCRMLQTIMPFAIKYNLNINTEHSVDETNLLAQDIKRRQGTVFVIWEHTQLSEIAKSLGITVDLPKWGAQDFDSIWIIKIKKGVAVFEKEKENIIPSDNCSF